MDAALGEDAHEKQELCYCMPHLEWNEEKLTWTSKADRESSLQCRACRNDICPCPNPDKMKVQSVQCYIYKIECQISWQYIIKLYIRIGNEVSVCSKTACLGWGDALIFGKRLWINLALLDDLASHRHKCRWSDCFVCLSIFWSLQQLNLLRTFQQLGLLVCCTMTTFLMLIVLTAIRRAVALYMQF